MSSTGAAPGSTASLRTANQRRVLLALRDAAPDDGAFTQAELARVTGLAPATVSNIVRDLSQAGLVDTEAGSGRRGSAVRMSLGAGVVAGVDIGHRHLAVAIGDVTGRLLVEERCPIDPDLGHREALALAGTMVERLRPDGTVLRQIGLGLAGPVTDGVIQSAAILPGWRGVDARSATREAFGTAVQIENDANLAALAEHRIGVARGHDSSVTVKISSGVGAGIVIANELFRGSSGSAGELGHLTVDEHGPLCRCGSRGCLETYTSVEAIQALIGGQLPGATLDEIVAAAAAGDVSARRAFEDAGLHLGRGLAAVVNLLNPSMVVIGGDMAQAGELILESVRMGLRRHALDPVAQTPVAASGLGERASLLGSLLLAAESTELLLEA
ncbi:ROK family protein [Pimelobacter simplex]|uniref:ROK-family transcriptional regulator n=1 Tax=Nocardioides simplex TaxID=2045 RepID=A0A0A1DIV1_NOCSI|nr:ROK family transcriptional regulator [Pimelobacter simplex]AIY16557.1 ROK-family transcriptional regulator [Pimelobacter simplex]KAB2809550.1 ROK family transcriptional regulator [Pimelobacter simplex]MCG8154248.1 ROK family protein [Pimelobacter simplex]SFN00553.1 Sugar kinase of the NBD/HSP70 family, may contain an N-terminal HTH domain [Pimelobacter simplex]GEB11694.1 transcriptional regulator [Pimelobacter simplex]